MAHTYTTGGQLKPDKQKTTFTLLNPEKKTSPRIIFGTTALKWIHAMVDLHPQEIGFYGIVDERPNYTFFVRQIFYPKNSEANSATCEISTEGEGGLVNWLIDNNKEDDISRVSLWCHSHHNMGTDPSGQDEEQAIKRMDSTQSFLIRAICNKAGEMSISFFDYDNKIKFDHIKWEIENDIDEAYSDSKINNISNVISSIKTSSEKLIEINNIINKDDQSDKIRKKIEELKKVNLPNPNNVNRRSSFLDYESYNTSFHNKRRISYNQSNLFPEDEYNSDKDTEDSIENFRNGFMEDEIFDKSEIDKMINNWEEKIGINGV